MAPTRPIAALDEIATAAAMTLRPRNLQSRARNPLGTATALLLHRVLLGRFWVAPELQHEPMPEEPASTPG